MSHTLLFNQKWLWVYTTRPSVQKDSGVSIVEDRQALFHLVQVQPLYTVSTHTMTMLMTSSFSPLILDIHIFSCCKKTNTRYREKIKVSNVLDKQALCLLVQVQPLYNTFHLCICKALMMGSLRLWLLDCDQKKRFSPCLPCNPLRLEIVCPRVPLRYLGGLPPNTWVPKGGSQ